MPKPILNIKILAILSVVLLGHSCSSWEDYYAVPEGYMEGNIWESISGNPDFSSFTALVEEYALDSIFSGNNAFTIFAPVNAGMDTIDFEETDAKIFIGSHIVSTVYLLRNIENSIKLQTLSGKFLVLERTQEGFLFNGNRISSQSEMHENGIYYTLEGASKPIDNLFQYVEQDSFYLDLELSRPVDINEEGQIIYDSVLIYTNQFEMLYFPVSEEFRDNRATLVIPNLEQYEASLDILKSKLNLDPGFEIPLVWQHQVLIPFILDHGMFEGEAMPEDFNFAKMKNIRGDSVVIDYEPADPFNCSNGLAYQYQEFSIPDSLYLRGYRVEGESLASSKGLDLFAWEDASIVKIFGEASFPPTIQKVKDIASNDSILYVDLGNEFNGDYAIEFRIENVFPGTYQGIWRSNPRSGGVYSVYVNGVLQTLPFNMTEFDLKYLSGGVVSVTGNQYFYPKSGYNMLDCLTTIETFGDVWIRLEYKGPGDNTDNGLIMDYFELVPY